MKTKIILFASAILMAMNLQAQAPEKFNYQGIARDNAGVPLANQALGLKISILHNATIDYSETHTVTTNDFGLYTLVIGEGIPVFGGMASVDWDSGNKFIKVEIDPNGGTNYTNLGTTELLSVPYALYALESGSSGSGSTTPTGPAGGDLSGSYPNPNIADNAVTTTKIDNGAVTAAKLAGMGATSGQVLKWDGTAWAPDMDIQGTPGTTYTAGIGISISGSNEISADLGIDIASAELQNNAVTSPKIDDGTVATVDLANDAVTAAKIDAMGATNGQVLQFDGSDWAPTTPAMTSAGWKVDGNNAGSNDFIGTTNDESLRFKVNNDPAGFISPKANIVLIQNMAWNTAYGIEALSSITNGGMSGAGAQSNTAIGYHSLKANTTGGSNTALGASAMLANTTGQDNTAIGHLALSENTTGSNNIAIGDEALKTNTTADNSVAIGYRALKVNQSAGETAVGAFALAQSTTGSGNVAVGYSSLFNNTTGDKNTAIGSSALKENTTGSGNTAVGHSALILNTTGEKNSAYGAGSMIFSSTGSENSSFGYNTMSVNTTGSQNAAFGSQAMFANLQGNGGAAFGYKALSSNTDGDYNSAFGFETLRENTTGSHNVAVGYNALQDNTVVDGNTAVGYNAMKTFSGTTGFNNTAIGKDSEISDGIFGAMALGEFATVTTSDHIVLGSSFTAQIGGYAAWSNLSDIRFKKDVQPQEHGLDFIMKLEPITYHVDAQKLFEFQNSVRENKIEETPRMAERMRKKASELQSGFSAQQVEAAAQAVGYDFNGVNAPKNSKGHYTISYSTFVVPMVKAIQEQQEMLLEQQQLIQTQQALLEKMQKRLTVLEQQ